MTVNSRSGTLEVRGGGVQRHLVGLDVDGGDGGKDLRREVLALQRELDELDDFLGVGVALAADAGDEGLGMKDEAAIDLQASAR